MKNNLIKHSLKIISLICLFVFLFQSDLFFKNKNDRSIHKETQTFNTSILNTVEIKKTHIKKDSELMVNAKEFTNNKIKNGEKKGKLISEYKVKKIIIKDKKIDKEVVGVGLNEKGEMETIDGTESIFWYEVIDPKVNNILIAGHRDWNKELGVFYYSNKWKKGLELEVVFENNESEIFVLDNTLVFQSDEVPKDILTITDGEYRVTIYTCYGKYIKGEGYESRIFNIFKRK